MFWIYAFEGHPVFGNQARVFSSRMRHARNRFLSSHLILAEVLVIPRRHGDIFAAAQYRHFFLSAAIKLVPLSADVAGRFADIRASTRIKPADALHLALAASAGTDYFVTYDTKLHGLTVSGIAHISPPDTIP